MLVEKARAKGFKSVYDRAGRQGSGAVGAAAAAHPKAAKLQVPQKSASSSKWALLKSPVSIKEPYKRDRRKSRKRADCNQ